jgi:DNA-binding NtrC family response regulator
MSDERVRLLAVDDDPGFLDDLAGLLRSEYSLVRASGGQEALDKLRTAPFDAVLLDLDLGGGIDGLEVLERIRRIEPTLPVFIVTKDASAASAVAALKRGATDYIDKTPNLADLERRIARAVAEQRGRLAAENRFLRREIDALKGEMIGESPVLRALREAIRAAAVSLKPGLIVGETGTGKELVARALHQAACPGGLFVPINCAAVPRDLFEAELFGSERGAYTGSERRVAGAFELAAGGLLFLDEITEIGASLQAALLRVIEQREFRPLGGAKVQEFTGRVVASTNRDLQRSLAEGRLRQDLYYRFSANVIVVPPLRERREDIPRLAAYFLDRAAGELKRPRPVLTPEALVRLCAHDWPGNVRELEHAIEAFVSTGRLDPARLTAGPEPSARSATDLLHFPYHEAKAQAVRRFQREYVAAVLAAHGGNVAAAAQQMGLSRFGLEKVLKQLDEPQAPAAGQAGAAPE